MKDNDYINYIAHMLDESFNHEINCGYGVFAQYKNADSKPFFPVNFKLLADYLETRGKNEPNEDDLNSGRQINNELQGADFKIGVFKDKIVNQEFAFTVFETQKEAAEFMDDWNFGLCGAFQCAFNWARVDAHEIPESAILKYGLEECEYAVYEVTKNGAYWELVSKNPITSYSELYYKRHENDIGDHPLMQLLKHADPKKADEIIQTANSWLNRESFEYENVVETAKYVKILKKCDQTASVVYIINGQKKTVIPFKFKVNGPVQTFILAKNSNEDYSVKNNLAIMKNCNQKYFAFVINNKTYGIKTLSKTPSGSLTAELDVFEHTF